MQQQNSDEPEDAIPPVLMNQSTPNLHGIPNVINTEGK
jgi:hypothetical protein